MVGQRELWTLLQSSFGLVWVFPALVRNLLLEWKVKRLGKKRRAVWRLASICLFWCIWGKQNRRTFQEEEMSDPYLRNLFFQTLLEWSQQFLDLDSPSFLEGSAFYLSRFFLSFCSLVFGSLCIVHVYVRCTPVLAFYQFNLSSSIKKNIYLPA